MKRMLLLQIALFFCCAFALAQQPAVQWYQRLGGSDSDQASAVRQTADGGYIVVGTTLSNDGDVTGNNGSLDIWVIKLDAEGMVQWKRTYGGSESESGQSIREITGGGYILAGHTYSNDGDVSGNHGLSDAWVVRLDADGDILWQRALGGSGYDAASDIMPTPDGGYIVSGLTTSNDGDVSGNNGNGSPMVWVVKLSETGTVQWQKPMGGTGLDEANSIALTNDGGYFVAGRTASNDGDVTGHNGGRDFWAVKLDANGNIQWQHSLGGSQDEIAYSGQQTADGGYILAGSTRSNDGDVTGYHGDQDVWVVKLDETGDIEWQRALGGTFVDLAYSIFQANDGGYVATGFSSSINGDVSGNTGYLNVWTFKLTPAGNIEWQTLYGTNQEAEQGHSIEPTSDGGYILAGSAAEANLTNADFLIVKLFTPPSILTGRIHLDPEHDCLPDDDETPLSGWLVQAAGQYTFYSITGADGHFSMPIDTGAYTVTAIAPSAYWNVCNSPATITVAAGDSLTLDFPAQAIIDCPLLTVDISAPLLRRCFDNLYTVHYCNYGTVTAEDAYVEVTLDPYLEYFYSTLPFSSQNGNTYTFELGDIAVNACGYFQIAAYLDCDSTVLGQTHCSEAYIFPDSLCITPNTIWDGSSVSVSAQCEGDSVVFTLSNTGTGDMSQPLEYIIIEDQIVLMQGEFQLDAMQIMQTGMEATGATLHMEAQQSPGHPSGRSSAGATVEGCGGWLSLGLFNQWANEGENPFADIDCQENIGSFDPNDKTGFPAGFTEEKLIEPGQELEYLLRFQNTGTDTAFTVVIVDVLPSELDLATLRPGAASHPYVYSVTPEGRPVFTFNDILLPDSTTNEAASQGFVRFRIAQQPGLALGTLIANSALIYFDFNEPIETNTTIHRLGQVFPWSLVSVEEAARPAPHIRVIPNPLTDAAWLQVEGLAPGRLRLVVSDALGRVVRMEEAFGTGFEFERGALPGGVYFFRMEREGRFVGAGKMVIRE